MLENQEKPFGHIYPRKRADGTIRSWRARYTVPNSRRTVSKDCPSIQVAQAWLQQEHLIVQADQAGISSYKLPQERERLSSNPRFHDWAHPYYYAHMRQNPQGQPLAPATLRSKDLAFARLDEYFGSTRLADITPRMIQAMLHSWQGSPTPIRTMYILLHALLRDAVNPPDGSAPLLERNPCVFQAPPRVRSTPVPAAVSEQDIAAIIHAMPPYTAISEIVHQGGEPKEVQTFGRHADVQVSLEHYQRARGAEKQRELANRAYRHLIGAARTIDDVEQDIADTRQHITHLTERLHQLYRVRDAMRQAQDAHTTSLLNESAY